MSSVIRDSGEEDAGTTLVCAGWVTSRRDQAFSAQGAVTILIPVLLPVYGTALTSQKKKKSQ